MPYKKSTQKKYGDNPLQKKSAFTLKSENNIGGRNGRNVNFKKMGSDSPVKQTNFIGSFSNFLKSKQTREGSDIGELKRRMRHANIEVRTKAQRENRERLKKARQTTTTADEILADTTEAKKEKSTEKYKSFEFTRTGGDPYSYRTKEGGGYEFQSRGTEKGKKAGRKKGDWYTIGGGGTEIQKAYEKAIAEIEIE